MPFSYKLETLDPGTAARAGRFTTAHGDVQTPAFMPVGTVGSVKTLTPDDLRAADCDVLLGNTYHRYLRPGVETVRAMGGLHKFMSWDRSILTDSGGFQVLSLGEMRKISEEGVKFSSPVNGDKLFLSPEGALQIQTGVNSDIVMQFDECTS